MPPESIHFSYSLRKVQASPGHQQSMAYQAAKRLNTFPAFRVGKARFPVNNIPQHPKASQSTGTVPSRAVPQIDHAAQLSHICRWSRSVPCRLAGCWFRLCEFPWARLIISVGFSVMFLSPWLLQSLLPLLLRAPWAWPNAWLWVSESASFSYWIEALWWQAG